MQANLAQSVPAQKSRILLAPASPKLQNNAIEEKVAEVYGAR